MKLITVEKMKELESTANAGGYSYEKMMIKAGQNLGHVVHERYFSEDENRVIGLVGGGNNGGDTLIALSTLQKLGWITIAYFVKEDERLTPLVLQLQSLGGSLVNEELLEQNLNDADVVLDGVIGTGFKPPLSESFMDLFKRVAVICEDKVVVAVDCPSGVDCVTGEVSQGTLKADLTVCMEAVKEGMVKLPAFEYCGELATVDLGIPGKLLKPYDVGDRVIDSDMVSSCLPNRSSDSHKGTFGHLLLCGGSVNYPGAPKLAARSAYRVGAGLVECAIPERIYEAVVANNSESIFTLLEDEDGVISDNAAGTLISKLSSAQCLLIGPGIGREEATQRFIQKVLFDPDGKANSSGVGFVPGNNKKVVSEKTQYPPLVIDADALRLLSKTQNWHEKLPSRAVLTPHPGEMAALTGLPIEEIQKDRITIARKYAMLWKQVVVLKGALTVVASPEGEIAVLPFANSALAKAGTGDVLSGIVAGLLVQGISPMKAAVAGVWIHSQAAVEILYWQNNEYSLIASDLEGALHSVFHWLKKSPR